MMPSFEGEDMFSGTLIHSRAFKRFVDVNKKSTTRLIILALSLSQG